MRNVAVLLAAGSGKRTQSALPKQFVKIAGKPMIFYTLEAFQNHPDIDEILLVLSADLIDKVSDFVDLSQFPKCKDVIVGGKERYESSLAAVNYYAGQNLNLLLHDVARPLLSQAIISRITKALQNNQAVCTAIPAVDTIAEYNTSVPTLRYPNRAHCYAVQTPQAFHISLIERAFQMFLQNPIHAVTDDCSVVHYYLPEQPICFVEGERKNMKVTLPEDFTVVETLLKLNK